MPKVRIPLVQPISTRDGLIAGRDSFVVNGYFDKSADATYVMKRPGTGATNTTGVPGTCQGSTYFNGFFYEVVSDTLVRSTGVISSSANGAACANVVPPWGARIKHGMLVFKDRLWVIAGSFGSGVGDVWSTIDGINWGLQTAAAGFGNRIGAGYCVFNGQMWCIGGFTGATVFNDVWSSPDGTNWTQVQATAPWSARYDLAVIAANNGIYVIGGASATNVANNEVWFSSDGVTWKQVTQAASFTARFNMGALFFQNKLWVIGGDSATGAHLNSVYSSVDGSTWILQTAAAFASGRSGIAATVYNNNMWVMCGLTPGGDTAEVYSSTTGAFWTLVSVNPGLGFTRESARLAVFKTSSTVSQFQYQTMYLTGGNNNVVIGKDNYRFTLNSNATTTYVLSPTTFGQQYQFNTFNNGAQMLLKNQTNFWVLDAGTLTKIVDSNYPPQTVPGLVVLNDFAYVMTPIGEIHACKIDDATIWPSLQFIIANFKDDQGVALVSYLNYIMAIGSYTIQYFYDAGLPPPGVSIAPYLNANVLVGMPDQNAPGQVGFPTFCNIANTVAFFGQTTNRDLGIFILNGMTPQKVSTSWIDKIFDVYLAGKSPRVWATSGGTGHEFVIVDVFSNAYVLVYDMTTKEWTYWQTHTQAGDGGFRYCNSLLVDPLFGGNIWVGTFDSNLYLVSPNYYWDGGETFSMMVQTGKIDGGTMQKKFCGIADFVADQNPSNVSIGWFDDDYQTLQGGSNINLNGTRPRMNRLGSFRRRAFRIYANDSAPARWEALELTVSAGES